MNPIQIPELEEFLAASRTGRRAPDRLFVSGRWHNAKAAAGIFGTLGQRYPEIQRITGGQLQTIVPTNPGEQFATSCWRSPVEVTERRVLCAVVGVYFHGQISPPRLRELQLKLRVICPTQPNVSVRPFLVSIPELTAMTPSIPRWVAMRLYSTGTMFYEKTNGQSSHRWTTAAG